MTFKYQLLNDGTYQVVEVLHDRKHISLSMLFSKKKVSAIEHDAFVNIKQLEEIGLSSNIKFVSKQAFQSNKNLKRIIVPENKSKKFVQILTDIDVSSSNIGLYENNLQGILFNQKVVQPNEVQQIINRKKIGDSLYLQVNTTQELTYVYENKIWKKVDSNVVYHEEHNMV